MKNSIDVYPQGLTQTSVDVVRMITMTYIRTWKSQFCASFFTISSTDKNK